LIAWKAATSAVGYEADPRVLIMLLMFEKATGNRSVSSGSYNRVGPEGSSLDRSFDKMSTGASAIERMNQSRKVER
jgi:hypothetical protein